MIYTSPSLGEDAAGLWPKRPGPAFKLGQVQ